MVCLSESGFDDGVGLAGCGSGCAGGGWWLWLARPDELTVLVSLSQDTDEARLAIKYSPYVLWCFTRFAPCGSDGQAHLILGGMSCAYVQAGDAGYCAAGGFVESCAVGSSGTGW